MAPTEEQFRAALSNHHNLQSQLSDIVAAMTQGQCDKDEAFHQLTIMQKSVYGIGEYLSATIPTEHYNERRASDSAIAAKVLQIPKLLEQILEHTGACDIINVSATCRQLKAIIEASPRLQTLLFLRPAGVLTNARPRVKFAPQFRSFPWLYAGVMQRGRKINVRAEFSTQKGGLPHVG